MFFILEAQMKKFFCWVTFLCLCFVSVYAETPEAAISGLLPEALGINVVSRMVGGKNYHFVTYHDDLGNISTKIFNSDFVEVLEDEIPVSEPKMISDEVIEAFEKNTTEKQRLLVGISFPTVLYPEHSFSVEGYIDELGKSFVYVNGELIDEFQHKLLQEEYDQVQDKYLSELLSVKSATWQELREKNTNLNFDEAMEIAQNQGRSSFVAEMTEEEMFELLENAKGIISSIELYHEPQDNLANAMLATSVDPYVFSSTTGQGEGVGIYMTETHCPPYNNGVLTTQNYYALGATWASQQHPQQVSYVLRTVSPQSFLYCRPGGALPYYYELNGISGKPPIKVINASFSDDTSEYTGDTRDWDQFIYNYNVTIVNSAGNTGESSGNVGEPSAALNSITVGNYIMAHTVSFMGNQILIPASINSTSSYVNPETGNQKPEVVAPGTNLTLPNFTSSGTGSYTGTSFSAPHVAAIIADYMSDFSDLTTRPHLTKAFILSAATDVVFGDSTKVGEGGVDYLSGYAPVYYKEWERTYANTDNWDELDAADYLPNNGSLDYKFFVHSSKTKVKVAISWATRGDYTYLNRTAQYPIGTDLDMCVYDPNGSLVGCSSSRFNNYETVTFDPDVTGWYRVKVSKFALRDTSSKLHIGLSASVN